MLLPRHVVVTLFVVMFSHTEFWRGMKGQEIGGPTPYSFLLQTLHRNCSSDMALTNESQWKEQIRILLQYSFLENSSFARYSCKARCGLEQRNASVSLTHDKPLPRCYCDNICHDLGDCCFDFDELCRNNVNSRSGNRTSNEICFAAKPDPSSLYPGYTVWTTCPQNWKEKSVRQKCQDEDEDDLLRNLPVFDESSHVTYKNIFCARCNYAVNTTYWRIIFDCKPWFNVTAFNLSKDTSFLYKRCLVDKKPKDFQLSFLKRCIPRFKDCHDISQEKNLAYCQAECLRYSFPVCTGNQGPKLRFRNPQCAMCNGFKPSVMQIECPGGTTGLTPPLSILFDFSSTSKHSIVVQDRRENVFQSIEKASSCSSDEVYDPYVGRCKKISLEEWKPNCTVITFNETDYELLPNGSIHLRPHSKIYSNITYVIRENRLLLCVNFSSNFSVAVKERGTPPKITKTPASLQLLTTIGCIVSMISLVLLLITYTLFAELRNLPGKIIINLTLSLLLYLSFFFAAVKSEDQDTCLAIAVLLHFFVLSSFTWMNVMAYDAHRTFTNPSGAAVNRQEDFKRRLMKYSLYAWGAPAAVVLVCVTVDRTKEGFIGYGQGKDECFISQPQALLYSFVFPVVLLMIFNLLALGHTVIHIVKTRKRTQQVTGQPQSTSATLICIKMASVMGVTWILGIAANVKALSYLWYPYVVLNSFQGLFIFLSFAATGKALGLYKSKMAEFLGHRRKQSREDVDNRRNRSCIHDQILCHPDKDQDKLETRM